MSLRTREQRSEPRRLRRITRVAGVVTVTALTVSLGLAVAAGAQERPALATTPALAVASSAMHATSLPPLAPPHHGHGHGPDKLAKLPAAGDPSSQRTQASGSGAMVAAGSAAAPPALASRPLAQQGASLLRSRSKASRTRGQPWQV
jgi:hypothetical protein